MMRKWQFPDWRPLSSVFLVLSSGILLLGWPSRGSAQVEAPERKFLFTEDTEQAERQSGRRVQEALRTEAPANQDLDFQAPVVEYEEETAVLRGEGGVLLSQGGLQMQSEAAEVDTETKDAKFFGDVLLTVPEMVIAADEAELNIDSEQGVFSKAKFKVEEGNFHVRGDKVRKVSDLDYELFDADLTSCSCLDGSTPWLLSCSEADITQEGYARTYGTKMELFDVPVFYSPYLAFPVKQERASGLLVPRYGYGSRDGVQIFQPFFLVVDDSTDFTFRPFLESRTRYGTGVEFRKVFSQKSRVETHWVYSNERARDGELRGTNVTGLFEPEFDEDRFGGFHKQIWRSDSDVAVPVSFIADVHYISDDLFLRELENDDIGRRNARYTTSRVLARASLGQYFTAEAAGEYNQALESDDDFVFQRLPELSVFGLRSFRPFGYNPYGLKVVTQLNAQGTNFARDESSDGWRYNINPQVRIPFHFKNYVNNELSLSWYQTYYSLRETMDVGNPVALDDTNDRSVFKLDYTVGTGVERVFDVQTDGLLATLTGLGAQNQVAKLQRVKHVIEPSVKFTYIPDTTQDDLPLWDSFDRIRERSLFTYGFRTALLGRFSPRYAGGEDIAELTPRVEDLPLLRTGTSLSDLGGFGGDMDSGGRFSVRQGQIRELLSLQVRQSYDYKEDQEDNDPGRRPWSDVYSDIGLYPSNYFGFRFENNFDPQENDFSSWGVGTHLRTDRGDIVRARYSYVERNLSQLEGNVELVLTDRLKLGYYSRFDDRDSEFIENRFAVRMRSSCDCWYMDVGFSDRINPDRQQVTFSFTFKGLGDITQDIGMDEDRQS